MKDWRKARAFALTRSEREFLVKAAKCYNPGLIVNIGIALGGSLYCLRAGAPDSDLLGIDIKKPMTKLDNDLRCQVIIHDSSTFRLRGSQKVSLLFVDGDHHYKGVKADISNWVPFMDEKDSCIIFHDYAPLPSDLRKNPWIFGVRKAVTEWSKKDWKRLATPDSLAAFRRKDEA